MKFRSIVLLIACITFCFGASAQVKIAATPPMGWNSYNCFGSAVHEDEVKANTDYMADKLKVFGWEYIVVDFLWSYDNPPGSNIGNPFQMRLGDGSYVPWLTMDKWGRLLPQPNKFPSALDGKGFKSLSDYVHSKGLKFGIHVMRGIPRQAVWSKTPVKGTNGITADMVADTNSKCPWMNHMYGLDMKKPGAQEYLNSILELYAGWGVDFIKVDDLSRPYSNAEVEGYKKAIDNCGRPMVLSLSPGETPVAQAAHATQYANMWRMADDFWDNWKEILHMFDYAKSWEGVGGPGHWPDADMIQIGKLSKRGPVGNERYSRFTEDEQYTHMTFWSIYRSPLMLGGNMPENRDLELKLFTNAEVLSANQQGENPKQLYKKDGAMVWYSHVQGSKDLYVALFNISDANKSVAVDFAALGLKGKVKVRDLWKKQDLGQFRKTYQQGINLHGAALLRLSSTN
ncbi:glycoside hydrolase family 27 protein [Mucilaginibacter psychrotolerans]|uniref:Alpha-galactosidase n=1 Tax=Mucilaginibacter psychrotolerans TaxID=1524096 RepID=A0A4Y8SDY6_9SPHI|nr:glycoside hydrolase family 27 protein [Mucilaginibacter psychrotolerans]TFF37112.1 glycoside hydrolase family 27 protein [Mucilaginibacter psychrotolerans]